jgi:hypothetical protein
MYMFSAYPLEAITDPFGDYVAFSHAGHGVNSYAINYHVQSGQVAFVRPSRLGRYLHGQRRTGNEDHGLVRDLQDTPRIGSNRCHRGSPHPRTAGGGTERLRGENVCGWLDESLDELNSRAWLAGHHTVEMSALETGLALLREKIGPA